jgi:hypothetical protein
LERAISLHFVHYNQTRACAVSIIRTVH